MAPVEQVSTPWYDAMTKIITCRCFTDRKFMKDTLWTQFVYSSHGPGSRRASANKAAVANICPSFVLSTGAVRFWLPENAVEDLKSGAAIEVLSQSGQPVLRAQAPAPGAGRGAGRCLELFANQRGARTLGASMETSMHASLRVAASRPDASAGPLLPNGAAVATGQITELRGPDGEIYGTLKPRGTGWYAEHDNRMVLFVDPSAQGFMLSASNADGRIIASAAVVGSTVRVHVNPGVDAMLTLLCILSVALMLPDKMLQSLKAA
mmetsp:Transcript_105204/g.297695  ORF Transcript_105204/g.297695 Transcript_105204/m.297695 type:complete len:265 (-) Transcript_105204:477-1271(-)|eukprot:CAMPEP_0179378408 /NCGR_PEP_ID=MMETSP0797-20121207/89318_1 /TAXON_ID=47934 /ORGANISM="Dinophysis acuminata, Strain DAEP01" /LENGTH=264 /DNA_ID=CAMNT_0021094475 /DNA_START=75 /DNA_END=869 /DNA_ORIENTATION=+